MSNQRNREEQALPPSTTSNMATTFQYSSMPMMHSHMDASYGNTINMEVESDLYSPNHNFAPNIFGTDFTTTLPQDMQTLHSMSGLDMTSAESAAFFQTSTAGPVASPATSHGDMMLHQRFSTSSDVSLQTPSSSTSAIPSPHMQPFSAENWHAMSAFDTAGLNSTAGDLHLDLRNINPPPPTTIDPSAISPFPSPVNAPPTYPQLMSHTSYEYASSPTQLSQSVGPIRSPKGAMTQVAMAYQPYPQERRHSVASNQSSHTSRSGSIRSANDIQKGEKGMCDQCGKVFKDLKTHYMTHQETRPEKCPIQSCQYYHKGFSRKYDKNRHTLTHYKGLMVCGFCPGTGSAQERSFNRADVFKRHLVTVHNVDQVPPNSRKKDREARLRREQAGGRSAVQPNQEGAGVCNTCNQWFANPQELYEHVDDCVITTVQRIEPSEEINQKHLTEIAEDEGVIDTLDKHQLPTDLSAEQPDLIFDGEDEDEEVDDDEDDDDEDDNSGKESNPRAGKGSIKLGSKPASSGGAGGLAYRVTKSGRGNAPRPGLTWSKGGVPRNPPMTTSGRKRRKDYPAAWGTPSDQTTLRKRVVCVFDGSRRLMKDDMMLNNQYEVRIPLPLRGDGSTSATMGGAVAGLPQAPGAAIEGYVPAIPSAITAGSYITDLDYTTVERAMAVQNATPEERGPHVPDNIWKPKMESQDEKMVAV